MKTISSRFLKGAVAVLLAVLMVFGSTLTGFAAVVENAEIKANVDIAETSASIIYLNPGVWNQASAVFRAWVWGASDGADQWIYFSDSDGDGIFEAELPHAYTSIKILRSAPGSTGWTSWNDSGDQSIPSGKNMFVVNDWSSFAWDTYTPPIPSVEFEEGTNIYLDLGINTDWTAANARFAAYFFGHSSGTTTWVDAEDCVCDDTNCYSFVVPGSGFTKVIFGRMNPGTTANNFDNGVKWNQTGDLSAEEDKDRFTLTQNTYDNPTGTWDKHPTLFKATFKDYNGSEIDVVYVESGKAPTPPDSPTREGYTFAGWSPTVGTITSDTTYTATYTKNTYTVRFLDINGNQIGSSQTVEHGATPTAPTAPAITGKTFAGWNPTVGAVTSNTDYQATYTDNMYSINYTQSPLNGTVTLGKSTNITYGESVSVNVKAPANYKVKSVTGATISNASGLGTDTYTGTITMPASDVTLVITYELAGVCAPEFSDTSKMSLKLGGTATRTATLNQFKDDSCSISYSSSDSSIASVDANGKVTAKKPGTVTITAKCSTSGHGTATYQVEVLAPKISVAGKSDLKLGETFTPAPSVTANAPASGSLTYTYTVKSGTSVNSSFKAVAAGKTTFTAQAKYNGIDVGEPVDFELTVLAPEFDFANLGTIKVNENKTVTLPTVTNAPSNPAYSYEYSPNNGNVSVTNGTVTGLVPGDSTITVNMKWNGATVATDEFTVKVADPNPTLNNTTLNLLTGQTAQLTVETGVDADVTWKTSAISTAMVSNGLITAVNASTATITATVKYNDSYSVDLKCTVTVAEPSLTVSPTTLDLEFGGGTEEGTITVTNNDEEDGADGVDALAPVLEATSSAPEVASVTIVDGNVKVTAEGVGTATITITYRGVTKTVEVNVTKYDPNVYVYFRNDYNWSNVYVYAWNNGYSTAAFLKMTKIGTAYSEVQNGNRDLYVYAFDKSKLPGNIIFLPNSSFISGAQQTNDINFAGTKAYSIYWDGSTDRAVKTYDYIDSRVNIDVENLDVLIGTTKNVEVYVIGSYTPSSYEYQIDKTNIASVDANGVVTGNAPGLATLTVTAYAQCNVENEDGKLGLVTVENSADAAPYVATTATATVTVDAGADRVITVSPSYTTDGTNYNDGVTGGTVNATYDGTSSTSISVPYNGVYELTATPADGYDFVGWYDGNNEEVSTETTYTANANEDKAYTAKFIKLYTVSVNFPAEGISTVTYDRPQSQTFTFEVKAGEGFSLTASPNAPDYAFDKWVFTGTAEHTELTNPILNVSKVTSNLTVNPTAERVYKAEAQIVTRYGTTVGGNVQINNQTSPVYVKAGEVASFTATVSNTFVFDGWYSDADGEELVSSALVYAPMMEAKETTLYAIYHKELYIYDADNNAETKLEYDFATDTYSATGTYTDDTFKVASFSRAYDTVSAENVDVIGGTHSDGVTVTGNANEYTLNYDRNDYDPTKGITYVLRPDGDNTYTMDITLQEAKKVAVTVNGEYIGDYAVGTTLEYSVAEMDSNYSDDKYIYDLKSSVATDMIVNDSIISVEIPDEDFDFSYKLGQYYYVNVDDESGLTITGKNDKYKAGDNVSITFTPNTGCTLNGVSYTIDGDTTTVAPEDGVCTVTFTMPEQNVDITVDASVQLRVSVQKVVLTPEWYDASSVTTTHFNVATTGIENGYTDGDITLNASITNADTAKEFSFVGYYTDSQYTESIGVDYGITALDYTVTEDNTIIYAVFAKNVYLPNAVSNNWNHMPMKLDPSTMQYYEVINAANTEFKLTLYANWNEGSEQKTLNIDNSRNIYTEIQDNNNNDYVTITDTENYKSLVVYYDGTSNDHAIYAVASASYKEYTKVYLSTGRRDLADNMSQSVYSSSTFTSDFVENKGTTNVKREWENGGYNGAVEQYTLGLVEDQYLTEQIEVSTTLHGDLKGNYFVKTFVLYHSDGYMEYLTSTPKGDNTYTTGFNVQAGKNYLVIPIYWFTEEYAAQQGKRAITVYFDRSEVPSYWGPFVACYPYGSNQSGTSVDLMAGWPGQLMIPAYKGYDVDRFYTQFVVDTATFTPQAVTFSNYMLYCTPNSLKSEFNLTEYSDNQQTYDYGEPVYLYNEGFSTITFKLMEGTDAYHGSSSISNKSNYSYELLVDESGKPMSLSANTIEGEKTVNDAEFYVVAGEKGYTKGEYEHDKNYAGSWSVDWHIFDKNGSELTTVLSGSLYDGIGITSENDDNTSVLVEQLLAALKTDSDYSSMSEEELRELIATSPVAISYEYVNNSRHDGQWYGILPDKEYTINVEVALQDANGITEYGSNEAPYGEAFISGDKASDDIVVGEMATLSATPLVDEGDYYRFVGWHVKDNDNYTSVETLSTFTPVVDSSRTYYAVFEKLSEGTVMVTQQRYNYSGVDTAIHSHNGVSTLLVNIYKCDEDGNITNPVPLASGEANTYMSSAYYEMLQDEYYKIELIATPSKDSKFFAWYQKAKTADGQETYEEVLTEKEYETNEKAITSFVYKSSGKADNIIIYADTITPGLYTKLVYHYTDRFGKPATYTIDKVMFNDQEIMGYTGNDNTPYMPTYITKYTMINPDTEETTVCYGDDEREKAENDGYTDIYDEYNMLKKYAPTDYQVDVYDSDIEWVIESYYYSLTSSVTNISAKQDDKVYRIDYSYNGTTGYKTGTYNTLLNNDIVADPVDDIGNEFSYWEEVKTVDGVEVTQIISYVRQYNYRITENKTIRAVYEGDIADTWTPTIDSVTKTRELSDNGDYIYTDYLITFANSEGKVLDEVKDAEGIRYGLTLTYDPQVAKQNTTAGKIANSTFVQFDTISEALKQVAIGGNHTSIMSSTYNTYCFELTGTDTTIFNRLDYYLRYSNTGKFDKYNFTAVAYIFYDVNKNGSIEANEVFLSNAEFVNFFTEANS